jgi:hypothetical protein
LLLIQAERMLDGVAACSDGVFLTFSAKRMACGLVPKAMGLVDECLQHVQRIGQRVLCLAAWRE